MVGMAGWVTGTVQLVAELLCDFFEVYVGVGWHVLILLGDCLLLLCGCGKMG